MPDHDDFDEATVNIDLAELEGAIAPATEGRAYLIILAGQKVGTMIKVGDEVVLGRSSKAGLRIEDDGISRMHCRLRQKGGKTFLEDMGSRNGTFVNGDPVLNQPLSDGDKIRIGSTTILKFTYQDDLDESYQQQLLDAALRDPLTDALNRRHLMERFDAELQFAARHRTPVSLIVIDLDHFKSVNDTKGHLAGDQVLKQVAARITAQLRVEDIFGRYGGEEFCVVCRGINLAQSKIVAERLRKAIASSPVPFEDDEIPVTASFGIAVYPDVDAKHPDDLFKAADEALYKAKEQGRNCVVVSTGPAAD